MEGRGGTAVFDLIRPPPGPNGHSRENGTNAPDSGLPHPVIAVGAPLGGRRYTTPSASAGFSSARESLKYRYITVVQPPPQDGRATCEFPLSGGRSAPVTGRSRPSPDVKGGGDRKSRAMINRARGAPDFPCPDKETDIRCLAVDSTGTRQVRIHGSASVTAGRAGRFVRALSVGVPPRAAVPAGKSRPGRCALAQFLPCRCSVPVRCLAGWRTRPNRARPRPTRSDRPPPP